MDDQQFIARAKQGDRKAMGELLALHQDKLLRTALGITGNAHDADDALQETALKSWLKIKTLRRENNFSAWLTSILINVCRDILRKKKELLPGEIKNEGMVEDNAAWLEFQELLSALSVVHREVVVLRFVQDLTFREISDITGTSESTVKYRLESALRVIKDEYQQAEGVKSDDL